VSANNSPSMKCKNNSLDTSTEDIDEPREDKPSIKKSVERLDNQVISLESNLFQLQEEVFITLLFFCFIELSRV
jgi:hypothetical protein